MTPRRAAAKVLATLVDDITDLHDSVEQDDHGFCDFHTKHVMRDVADIEAKWQELHAYLRECAAAEFRKHLTV
jgi:hypothetical protein